MLPQLSLPIAYARRWGASPTVSTRKSSHNVRTQQSIVLPATSTCGRHAAGEASCVAGRLAPHVSRRTPRGESAAPSWICRSVSMDPIPEGLRLEVKPDDGTANVDYDEENKVVRIPLSALGPEGQRRSKLVLFTCNKCGGRTARMVNPVAWEQGVVFGQCGKCEVWHVLSAKNKKIFEEVRYKEDPEYRDADPVEQPETEESSS